jgi:UDP-N-acetylglucosamine transferase subunit ALG13
LTQWSDVVISHGGVGSLLACLDQGKVPFVLPRESRFQEHVDDHQVAFSKFAAARGVAVLMTVRSSREDLERVALLGARTHRVP